ncbi:MAG: DUF512 domain-containing protein [Chloroflexi bacterium]|nr:DUF512 domain-containing protein [Chloroflexota bacterium]
MRKTNGGLICAVKPASLAAQAGLRPGDRLLAINNQPLRDIIDYRYYSAEEHLELSYEREGTTQSLALIRDYDSDLGIEFSELVFDGMRLCRNRCPFCFVDQMPRGLRPSLYIHDDDYRYSFLLGNYVTLTNLTEDDWQRIGEQGLSPLYVSIHAADLANRRRVLGNPRAPDIMVQLKRLNELGTIIHGQVVIWPGVNDGAVLRQTIEQTAALWPCVQTLALVPVGVTTYKNVDVRRVQPEEAAHILDLADELRARIRPGCDCTWLYPADELYLLAGRPIPPAHFYDDDAQWQNGIGMVRNLIDDWRRAKRRIRGTTFRPQTITLACGELIAPTLKRLADELASRWHIQVKVVAVPNDLFGRCVTVSGLLSGADVCAALAGQDLGECLFLPSAMFAQGRGITLDDMALDDLIARLHVPISTVSTLGEVVDQLAADVPPAGM